MSAEDRKLDLVMATPTYTSGITGYQNLLKGSGGMSGRGAYGVVPTVPSPQATQAAAATGNINALADLGNLASLFSGATSAAAQVPYTANLPGYTANLQQAAANTGSLLQGQVPSDVWYQLQQKAAERGTAIGSPGSPNANAALLRALGLTSLQEQQTGLQNLTTLMGAIPKGQQLDLSSMMVTPMQQQEWQWLAEQASAAPDPYQAAMAELAALNAGMSRGGGAAAARTPTTTTPTTPTAGVGTRVSPYAPADTLYGSEFTYTAPGGSSLVWTGQDWGDLFGESPVSMGEEALPYSAYGFTGEEPGMYDLTDPTFWEGYESEYLF